ncbi:MAG: hypothetical protein WC595_06395 [Candidatus Nanoarchaeia archaeon]
MKAKNLLKSWRIWVLIFALVATYAAIDPSFGEKGIVVNSVDLNSSANLAGMRSPSPETALTNRERITRVDQTTIETVDDFTSAVDRIQLGNTYRIQTSQAEYALIKTNESVGVSVSLPSSSNLRKGLDLQGGTRVLLQPVTPITDNEMGDLIALMEQRLNVYGLTDLSIKSAADLEGNRFIVVEIAGASKEEVKELIAGQGTFEAKIGDEVVFEGGQKDITFVCRKDGTCSRVTNCQGEQGAYVCRFEFEISLSNEAAERHSKITEKLNINVTNGQRVLEKTLDFYLDGKQVDSLQIAADLKGQKATRIVISGPGSGASQKEAVASAVHGMNKLQTVLITGSLPTKLEIVKLDSISPSLGEAFVKNTILVMILSIIAVSTIIYLRYRVLKIVIPIIITVLSEVVLILGLAAVFKQNIDLATIAGIIASVGTGVNDQIVITDEILFGNQSDTNVKGKIKNAFFVILAAYATIMAAMLPLLRAGAGLLTGFAVATIAGVTVGVLITRPAFAAAMRVLMEK